MANKRIVARQAAHQQQIEQAKQTLFTEFQDNLPDKKVAKRELAELCQSAELAGASASQLAALLNKKAQLKQQIEQISWQNLVHVMASAPQTYAAYTSLQRALNDFAEASQFIESSIKPYLLDNSVFFFEICFNEGLLGQKTYFIHAHIMCEYSAYKTYLLATKPLGYRLGKNPKQHYIATRCKQKERDKQTDADYQASLTNYNLKTSLHQDSQCGKRKVILPSSVLNYQYAIQKLDLIKIHAPVKKVAPSVVLDGIAAAEQQQIIWQNYEQWQAIRTELVNQSINSRKNSCWIEFISQLNLQSINSGSAKQVCVNSS